jgi:hypothetical protein
MQIKRPSPSMAVAVTALVFAMTGTGVAAVNFAQNAGAVDGKSAVADGASRSVAAGRLVAAQRSGAGKGTINQRYLDPRLARGATSTFGKSFQVQDNQTLAPEPIGSIPGLGALTASCTDQNGAAGKEDPATTLVFANQSGDTVNVSRVVGQTDPTVEALGNGVQTQFAIPGSNMFELHVERKGVNYFVRGVVRQDGRNTDNASCLVYGFSLATGT